MGIFGLVENFAIKIAGCRRFDMNSVPISNN